jgi:catechol 2,3-dioxygenase-like lactoylglutathione lyase family enzyme
MPVVGLDHLAMTVADVEATLDWYERVLGAERLLYDLWRAGTIPIAMLQVGASRLSIHPASAPASPHARVPMPGSADVCFRFAGPVADAVAMVGAAGVAIVEGPVPRPAATGERGMSIYVEDPDGNLVELLADE